MERYKKQKVEVRLSDFFSVGLVYVICLYQFYWVLDKDKNILQ